MKLKKREKKMFKKRTTTTFMYMKKIFSSKNPLTQPNINRKKDKELSKEHIKWRSLLALFFLVTFLQVKNKSYPEKT